MFYAQLLLLIWPLYQITEVSGILPFRFYLVDFFVLLAILANINNIRTKHPLFVPSIVFVSCALFSLLLNNHLFSMNSLYFVRLSLYLMLIFVFPKTPFKLLPSLLIMLSIGLLQYFLVPDLRLLKYMAFDDHYYRLTLPFFDPNFTGAAIVFVILFFLSRWKHRYITFVLAICVMALALTFSRASFLSLFVGLVYLFVAQPKFRLSGIILSLCLVIGVLLSPKPFGEGVNLFRSFSISSRLTDTQNNWNNFVSHPLIGNPTKYESQSRSNTPSNSFLFILNSGGIIAFAGFSYLVFSLFKYFQTDHSFQAGLMAILVHSFFNNTFFYAPIFLMICLFVATYGMYFKTKTFSD